MKLFIFEPFDWDYCGGAIGIVANTYEEAINHIVAKAKWELWKTIHAKCEDFCWENEYRKNHFAEDPSEFEGNGWDQWLLTHTFEVGINSAPAVVVDNWNFA